MAAEPKRRPDSHINLAPWAVVGTGLVAGALLMGYYLRDGGLVSISDGVEPARTAQPSPGDIDVILATAVIPRTSTRVIPTMTASATQVPAEISTDIPTVTPEESIAEIEAALRNWRSEYNNYIYPAYDNPDLIAVNGLYTGEYEENLPLTTADGRQVGNVDLAIPIYILNAQGKLEILNLAWIVDDLKGHYFLGTFAQFSSREEALDYWFNSVQEWGKFHRGYPINFVVSHDYRVDISADEPRVAAGLFDYYQGRSRQFGDFVNTGIDNGLVMLPTNTNINPNLSLVMLP